jgi:hypothetical protein
VTWNFKIVLFLENFVMAQDFGKIKNTPKNIYLQEGKTKLEN